MEHPFSGSWGYQVLGFFAPTSRFGPPEDFKFFVDACHHAGIGVILDWVPGPLSEGRARAGALRRHRALRARRSAAGRAPGLGHADLQLRPQRGAELPALERAVLARGVSRRRPARRRGRVDAVPRLLARARASGFPTDTAAARISRPSASCSELNTLTHGEHPGTITAAEESTSFPGVSRPVHLGGLGFTYKWNMGWMHDMLEYAGTGSRASPLGAQPDHVLRPLHVHGELHPALLARRGRPRQRARCSTRCRATRGRSTRRCARSTGSCTPIRARSCCSWAASSASGASGTTIAASTGICSTTRCTPACGATCRRSTGSTSAEPALHEGDFDPAGFRWIDCNDNENSVISFVRHARGHRRVRDRRRQLHAGAAGRLPHRRARAGLLRRAAQQRQRAASAAATSATAAASTASRSRRTASISRCA